MNKLWVLISPPFLTITTDKLDEGPRYRILNPKKRKPVCCSDVRSLNGLGGGRESRKSGRDYVVAADFVGGKKEEEGGLGIVVDR